ncbi:MAG: AAA family ATPase [Planctomycetes bacterium]|nr:AAA family ATPase [Planctomycetota bacterium]
MGQAISKLTIKGYKSIRNLEDFELRNINILIGPNGAGKSNFVSFFDFLLKFAERKESFDAYVQKQGGADRFLYLGPKTTHQITISFCFSPESEFSLYLDVTSDNRFVKSTPALPVKGSSKKGVVEILDFVITKIHKEWRIYHFHDTSNFAAVKRTCSKRDYEYLRPDASNLAAFLLFLKKKHESEYQHIRETVQLAAPFFDDFLLRDSLDNPDETLLEWRQKGSDYPFHPSQISDGTLRFICLATALLQPKPPSTILLDEPELGLHPSALAILAGLIQKASYRAQVIVSTQSAALIDHFQPEDIILVERKNDESVFSRPDTKKLKIWLEDYSLGDIWSRNIIEGTAGQ